MQILTSLVLVLPTLAFGSLIKRNAYAEDAQPAVAASPASIPTSESPVATLSACRGKQLRQAHDPADIDSTSTASTESTADTSLSLAPSVAAGPIAPVVVLSTTLVLYRLPVVTTTSSVESSIESSITSSINTNIGQPLDYTTTKWVETWVGGTYSTWTPTVITVIHKTPAPAPPVWQGEIGMGSLTGETGKTQTVYMAAAPSQAANWAKGVVAMVGVGIVGVVV